VESLCEAMASLAASWRTSFPYRNTRVVVERLPNAWCVTLGERQVQARTLVTAFELLLQHPAADAELDVVLAALARDCTAKQGD
jgi:hypothetical protein